MVSVLHKQLEYRVEKLNYFQLVYKSPGISPHKVLRLWLTNTVYHLLLKNSKREGRVGLKERGEGY